MNTADDSIMAANFKSAVSTDFHHSDWLNACRLVSGFGINGDSSSSGVDSRMTQIFLNFAQVHVWQEQNEKPPARVSTENR